MSENRETSNTDIAKPVEPKENKQGGFIDQEFQYYRSQIVTLSSIVIALSSSILALILKDRTLTIVDTELTAKIFWGIAIFCIFISVVVSLITIICVIKGYYLQANKLSGHNSWFNVADRLIFIGLLLFLVGFFIGFAILVIEYFK